MLERDYIMRLIREFMAALARMLEKKEIEGRREALRKLYEQYVGPYDFYHIMPVDDIMQSFTKYPESERLHRMEMLAELYYAEADMLSEPMRGNIISLALSLFGFVDRNSKTFSFDRRKKMDELRGKSMEIKN
ncbi:MAG: hypothetical protein KHX42_06180 [Prevotella sp.]|nr:hypothetical protein [Prevotella sp.]